MTLTQPAVAPLHTLVDEGRITYGIVQPGGDTPNGVPIVRVKDLKNGSIDTKNPMRVSPIVARRHSRTTLRGGEVLLSLVGTVGEAAVVPAELAGWNVARAIAVIRPVGVEADWLCVCFETSAVRENLSSVLNTTVQSTLNLSDLSMLPIPVPEKNIRDRILDLIGALDDKIAANNAASTTAHELASKIFESVATTAPGQPMSVVLTPVLGGTPSRSKDEYWAGELSWASARDVTSAPFGVILDTAEKISELSTSETRAKPLIAGSVILTARGTVGAVARLGVASSFNQSCYGFTPGALPEAILYFSVLYAVDQAKAYAHGSVFSTITATTFDHLIIPALASQATASLESRLKPLLDSITASVRENSELASLRDTLLPHLMSGRLRVKDAEKHVEAVV